ncbi:hypothetical protein MTO96_033086 [Rhipicephalus appendiculatus]
MPRLLWSRSPSVVLISSPALARVQEQQIWQRYRAQARRHWKEVFASFILLASFMMVLLFISAWNKRMTAGPKKYRGSRQQGPFGRRETAPPDMEQTPDPRKLVARAALEEPAEAEDRARAAVSRVTTSTTAAGQAKVPDNEDGGFKRPGRNASLENMRTACNNSVCQHLKDWFVDTVGRQADPCKKRNTFVCDSSVTFPSFPENDTEHTAEKYGSSNDSAIEHFKYGPTGTDGDELMQSCAEYARNPQEGVQDVLSFLSRFNLDIRHMVDDPTEDPLKRMMELSLEYGVDTPVAFSRKYDVIGEASAPFVIDIALNPEMNEFIAASRTMGEEDIEVFYRTFLSHYALVENTTIKEQLMDSDDEISEFVNDTYGSNQPVNMSIASLSNSTGVTQDHWIELLTLFGRSKHASHKHVTADEQALTMVAYLSRPDHRLHNRLVLAWHVLRYLVGPKLNVLSALNTTGAYGDLGGIVTLTPEDKCRRLVENVIGVPYKALWTCWKQDNATTTEQDQAATARNFLKLWLRRLRAWHVLPPLVQALLPGMASVVNVDSLSAFFRPPYYDARALPAYNFAALGQIIAQAMAQEMIKRRRDDPVVGERWRRFWDGGDHVTGSSMYCLYAGSNEENELTREARLDELLGSRIAYLAFQRARNSNASDSGQARTLPGVLLSSKQLFFVMHCALSCAMGGDHGPAVASTPDRRCVVAYKTRKHFIDTPCGKASGEKVPNECRYL